MSVSQSPLPLDSGVEIGWIPLRGTPIRCFFHVVDYDSILFSLVLSVCEYREDMEL